MYFFIIKAITGAILGQSTNTWFKKTKAGVWFYGKVDQCYTWAVKRYDIKVLTAEEKSMKKYPVLSKRLDSPSSKLSLIVNLGIKK